ncbi:MAG TPA: hypothetical protein VF316_17705, partial [Polyangiaceae bacterium]
MKRLGLLVLAVSACSRPAPAPDAAPVASASAPPAATSGSGLSFTFADASPERLAPDAGAPDLARYLDAPPLGGKSV